MKTKKEILKKYGYGESELELMGNDILKAMDEYAEQEQDESKQLYIAASQVLHLHLCEQEGIGSGQPTPKQWLDAVDKLSKALHP